MLNSKGYFTVLQMYNDWSTLKILHCEGETCHLYMMLNKVRNKRGWFAMCSCGNITLAMGRTTNTVGGGVGPSYPSYQILTV